MLSNKGIHEVECLARFCMIAKQNAVNDLSTNSLAAIATIKKCETSLRDSRCSQAYVVSLPSEFGSHENVPKRDNEKLFVYLIQLR